MKKYVVLLMFFIGHVLVFGQAERTYVRKGNKQFKEEKYDEASVNYQKAIDKNPTNDKAGYNLGNALYQQQNFQEAEKQFSNVADMTRNSNLESRANYNTGNALMSQGKYAESIPFYKNALRLNPHDEDARYNLSYAMLKIQEQKEQQEQNKQDQQDQQKDQQDQQQDNNDQKQDQQDQEQSEQDQQQDQRDDEGQQQQSTHQPQLSKEDAERMLQALTGEEKNTLEKLQEQKVKAAVRGSKEKDW